MDIIQAIFLGVIQGITEMLPISSSGHLVLVPWLFNFTDPGLAFDVALHLGTLVALLLYFWKDWWGIFKDVFRLVRTGKIETFNQRMAGYLALASVPGAIFGVLLNDYAETVFRNPLIIVFTLTGFGLLLLWADKKDRGEKTLEKNMSIKDSLTIGLSQAVALIPGVSRSGITMTTGLLAGYKKEDVAKFSFMMSAPIIAGAGLVELIELKFSDINIIFVSGIIASVFASFLAIGFLLNYVKKRGFAIFAYYRFILAAIILLFIIFRG